MKKKEKIGKLKKKFEKKKKKEKGKKNTIIQSILCVGEQ